MWIAAAGSDKGLGAARTEFAQALRDPQARARRQGGGARASSRARRSSRCRATAGCSASIDWGKQNLADLTLRASDLQIRWTNQGKQFPAPLGTVKSARWFGAGFPDYPWIFATDGEYTAFAAMALGQFQTAEDHLRTLRDISDVLNDRSGIVVHETVADGSVYFGHDSQTTTPTAKTNDFNTDETIKFPSIVALIWRWTGDDRFRDDMYDFAKRNLHAVDDRLDVDKDGWPEGSGNVERPGMGPEKLDNGVYYIRALLDLADMARAKQRRRHRHVGDRPRRQAAEAVRDDVVVDQGQPVRGLAARPGQHAVVLQALDRPGADGGRAHERRRGDARRGLPRPRHDGARRARGPRATAATAPAAAASSTPAAAAARTARATSRSSR